MSTASATAPLSAEEKAAIVGLFSHYPTKRAACIDALRHVQKQRGWVSDQSLAEVAGLLDMSTAELDEVATFYNLIFRKPVGEHVLYLCDSITCWVIGRDGIARHLNERLGVRPGETTRDGKLTFLPIVCLGHCDHAPALMLDEALHGDVDTARLDDLINDLMKAAE